MRVLVTGSRDWTNELAIRSRFMVAAGFVNLFGEGVTLISGACPTGADAIAERVAYQLGWKIERYPADWTRHGKRAGFVRNAYMVDECAPDLCFAFIKNGSKGASMTHALALKAGLRTCLTTE